MTGQFDDTLTLPASGSIEVKGPLQVDDVIDSDIKSAVIHFLIVQGEGDDAVTAVGQGHWARPASEWTAELPVDAGRLPDDPDTPVTFSTDVQNGTARGIGLAIAIKPGKVRNRTFVPPAIQALTWCAEFKFVPETTT